MKPTCSVLYLAANTTPDLFLSLSNYTGKSKTARHSKKVGKKKSTGVGSNSQRFKKKSKLRSRNNTEI